MRSIVLEKQINGAKYMVQGRFAARHQYADAEVWQRKLASKAGLLSV